MATKPWLGAIKEPTKPYYKSQGKAPNIGFHLEYAHGYRTKDCRNNLKFVGDNRIAYHTAGLGVLMDVDANPLQQMFFDKHTDDIISMAWSDDRKEIYTGEMGAKPVIHCWDSEGNAKKSYRGAKKGVSALAVNEKYLVGAGLDDDHNLYVFSKDKATLIASEKGGRDVIISIKWTSESSFVSVGVKHFRLWQFDGKTLKGKTGIFGKNCNLLCCVEVVQDKVYCGAANGEIQSWQGNTCAKSQKAHKGAVNAICLHGDILLTGANDSTVVLLRTDSLQVINRIDCLKLISDSVNCSIRAIDAKDNRILLGTLGSEIYELKSNQAIENATEQGKFNLEAKYMAGHYAPNFVTNEVWGLSLRQNNYMTCADDGTLRIWDTDARKQFQCVDLKFTNKLKPMVLDPKEKQLPDSVKGRCVCESQDGYVVVGCKDGSIRVLDGEMRAKSVRKISKKEISQVKFSPDGTMLAVGSHDCKIYLFEWLEDDDYKLKATLFKHSSYIKHFDFSRDGNYLHSTCGAYELLFWDTYTGKQVTSGATLTRDEEWASWTVTLGWPVQGIFEPFMDGTDINAVGRSNNTYDKGMRLLASGDDMGHVRLLEYPCVAKNSESVKGMGHSSHVTNVMFSADDRYVFSSGGEDQTILQWRMESD